MLALMIAAAVFAAACSDDDDGGASPGVSSEPTISSTVDLVDDDGNTIGGDVPTEIESTVDLVEALRPSVVHILAETSIDVFGQTTPQSGVGTGFIIDTDGHIVTNNHVITDGNGAPVDSITVTLADGREFEAEVVGRDAPTDVAVLQIDADDLVPVAIGQSSELRVGQEVVAMGNALNLPGGPTVTKGVISAVNRLIQEENVTIQDAIQTDAAINPGNSGGPLVNANGEVIGITTAVIRGNAEGIGLAISIDSAEPIIQELIANGEVDRGFLGVNILEITESLASQFDLPVDQGIGITLVQEGGPADDAGLLEDDIIVRIEDTEIETSADLFQVLSDHRAGEEVTVTYYRGANEETTELTLG